MPPTPRNFHRAKRFANPSLVLLALIVNLQLLPKVSAQALLFSQPARCSSSMMQSGGEIRVLEQGKPVARELKGGESHTYQFALNSGQYLKAIVDQHGIDVVVRLFVPDGQKLLEHLDSPKGSQGPEVVMAIAEVAGNYRLEVHALDNVGSGRYEARIEEVRTATLEDKDRVTAKRLLMEAVHCVRRARLMLCALHLSDTKNRGVA